MIPAKIVMARPETIWFTRIVMVKKAWMSAIAPPATRDARMASNRTSPDGPCIFCETQEGGHRPHQHHSLDTEVEHPGALGEQLAEAA